MNCMGLYRCFMSRISYVTHAFTFEGENKRWPSSYSFSTRPTLFINMPEECVKSFHKKMYFLLFGDRDYSHMFSTDREGRNRVTEYMSTGKFTGVVEVVYG